MRGFAVNPSYQGSDIMLYYLTATLVGIGATLGVLTATLIGIQVARISDAPKGIPWVGLDGRRWLPKLRATLGEFSAGRQRIKEGYEKVHTSSHAIIQ